MKKYVVTEQDLIELGIDREVAKRKLYSQRLKGEYIVFNNEHDVVEYCRATKIEDCLKVEVHMTFDNRCISESEYEEIPLYEIFNNEKYSYRELHKLIFFTLANEHGEVQYIYSLDEVVELISERETKRKVINNIK